MFVIIAGGGRTASQLTTLLLVHDHDVRVLEDRPEILRRMHQELPSEVIFEGKAIDPVHLEAAGIEKAHVLAAITPSDADNLVLCYLARERYKVPRIIARVNDPRNAWLFTQDLFHVDAMLNPAQVLSALIQEQMSLGDMMTLLKLNEGDYSLVEEKVPADAPIIGKAIKDLGLSEECVIAAIIRHGKVVIPRGITTFEPGDEVLAITNREGAYQLARLLTPVK